MRKLSNLKNFCCYQSPISIGDHIFAHQSSSLPISLFTIYTCCFHNHPRHLSFSEESRTITYDRLFFRPLAQFDYHTNCASSKISRHKVFFSFSQLPFPWCILHAGLMEHYEYWIKCRQHILLSNPGGNPASWINFINRINFINTYQYRLRVIALQLLAVRLFLHGCQDCLVGLIQVSYPGTQGLLQL